MQTYIIKVARTGEDGEKVHLLLEAGVRFHSTAYARDKNLMPSSFSMKLRKHIKGKRITDIAQLGIDRVVAFTFGAAEATHHLLLELYAAGNIILADGDFRALALLRAHMDAGAATAVAPGQLYPVSTLRLYTPVDRAGLAAALSAAADAMPLKRAPSPPFSP